MWLELKFAIRALAKNPALSLCIVGSLGLGLGTLSGVATVRDAIRGRRLTLGTSDRLVHLYTIGSEFPDGRVWTVPMAVLPSSAQGDTLFESIGFYQEAYAT